jgi:hypothetical protein
VADTGTSTALTASEPLIPAAAKVILLADRSRLEQWIYVVWMYGLVQLVTLLKLAVYCK